MTKDIWEIEKKFLWIILPPVVLAAVLVSLAFGLSTYQSKMEEFGDFKKAILAEAASSIVAPLWNFDKPSVIGTLETVIVGDGVESATVINPDGIETLKVGVGVGSETSKIPLVYNWDGEKHELGTLIVSFDSSEISAAVVAQVVADSALLLILVATILFSAIYANKRIVRRPMEALLSAIQKAEESKSFVTADWTSDDEMGRVVRTFNRMVNRISEEEKSLRKAKAEAEAAKEEALRLACTDPLTGMNNRRAFFDFGRVIEEQAQRAGLTYSIIVLDIDHFKVINDTLGHQSGDEVIKDVANAILGIVRASDIPGRIGGEEFAIILPNTSVEEAMPLADRLRTCIEKVTIVEGGKKRPVTASFGVADGSDGEVPIDKVINWADSAMYSAKQAGRNRVSYYGSA